jgi:hypothetical protein
VLAKGSPSAVTRASGAAAFQVTASLSGEAIRLSDRLGRLPGVVATYPHGGSLRVVAKPDAAPLVHRIADESGAGCDRVGPTLEDAALALAPGREVTAG